MTSNTVPSTTTSTQDTLALPTMPPLSVSPSAYHHILHQGLCLRIRIQSGGCSGLRCLFDFQETPQPGDRVCVINAQGGAPGDTSGDMTWTTWPNTNTGQAESANDFEKKDGAYIIIDPLSWIFVQGAHLNYIEEIMASQFSLTHPKATNPCGCGDSFSLIPNDL